MSDLNRKYVAEFREKSDPNTLSDLNKKYINEYRKISGKQYICKNRDYVENFRNKKRKIIQEFEENNVDSIVISYKQNVIPNPYIIEKDFEHNALKSQLLWYYNSGLHRFSEIDNLPSKEAEKNLIKEIELETPTFEENQALVNKYISFYNKKNNIVACASCGIKYLEGPEHKFYSVPLSECESLILDEENTNNYLEDMNKPPIEIPIDNLGNTKEVNPFKVRLFFEYTCKKSCRKIIYFLHPDFVEKKDNDKNDNYYEASLCENCNNKIKKGEVPDYSLAKGVNFGDFRRIGLEEPNLFERVAISRVRFYMCVIKMKYQYDVGKIRSNNRHLKGHAISFDHDAPEVVSNIFSEEGFKKTIKLVLMGENDQMDMLAKDTIGTFSLTGRAYVLYQWIACLKVINRYYKDISLPPFEEVKSILDKTIKKIIIDESHKVTSEVTRGIDEALGDDIAKVRFNNTDQINDALMMNDKNCKEIDDSDLNKQVMKKTYER